MARKIKITDSEVNFLIDLNQDLTSLIKKGIALHGHLGPFLVIGIRMGRLARQRFNSKGYFDLRVTVETGTTPPVSCIIDGIQVSTGCTSGKGNIKVVDQAKARATFSRDKEFLIISLRPEAMDLISQYLKKESMERAAEKVANLSEEELFLIDEGVVSRVGKEPI